MNNQTRHKPTTSKFSLLRQLCNFIPPHLVPRLARETGVEDQARTFSPWSHVVSLLYAQLTHSLGLPMSLLTELDSLASSNYKDSSPTGLKNRQQ